MTAFRQKMRVLGRNTNSQELLNPENDWPWICPRTYPKGVVFTSHQAERGGWEVIWLFLQLWMVIWWDFVTKMWRDAKFISESSVMGWLPNVVDESYGGFLSNPPRPKWYFFVPPGPHSFLLGSQVMIGHQTWLRDFLLIILLDMQPMNM